MSSDEFIEDDDNLSSDSECSQAVEESLEAPKSDEKVDIKPATVRQTVDSVKLSSLMAIHARHFSDYSKGRRNVTQLIPKKIWPLVRSYFSQIV